MKRRQLRGSIALAVAFTLGATAACTSSHHGVRGTPAAASNAVEDPASATGPSPTTTPPATPAPGPLTPPAAATSPATAAAPATAAPATTGESEPAGSDSGSSGSAGATSPAGAEGATPATTRECPIATSEAVASSYGGTVGTESAGTSPIGNPICQFSLTRSNTGDPGHITIALNASMSAATFAKIKRQAQGAVSMPGIDASAFYVPATLTMQFLKGHNAVVIQADLRAPHGLPRDPDRIRGDTAVLARAIAANL